MIDKPSPCTQEQIEAAAHAVKRDFQRHFGWELLELTYEDCGVLENGKSTVLFKSVIRTGFLTDGSVPPRSMVYWRFWQWLLCGELWLWVKAVPRAGHLAVVEYIHIHTQGLKNL